MADLFPFLAPTRDPAPSFAEPRELLSLSAWLADPIKTEIGTMTGFEPEAPEEASKTAWGGVLRAALRSQTVVDNTYARQEAIEEATERRIAAIEKATGVRLRNFARIPPTIPTMFGMEPDQPQGESSRDEFHRRLTELESAHPDAASAIRSQVPIEEDAREIARTAAGELKTALADPNLSTTGAVFGSLVGGIAGSFRDPLQVVTLFAGGGPGTAATALARIGQVAIREGLYNAGAVAMTQPQVQSWRAEAGLESGILPALENVGFAFLVGGIIGGPIQGVRELKGPARASVERVLDGTATPQDTLTAARALDLEPQQLSAIEQAFKGVEADEAALARAPAGVDPDVHADLAAAAQRYAEDPVNNPPPAALVAEQTADPLIAKRVAEAQPQTQAEARMVAADAMEEIGTKNVTDALRNDLRDPPVLRNEAGEPIAPPEPGAEPVKRPRGEVLDKVASVRDDGSVAIVSRATNAKAGARDVELAELVRACK